MTAAPTRAPTCWQGGAHAGGRPDPLGPPMRWWQGRARPPRRGVLGRRRPVGLGSGGGRALRPAALAGSFRNERGRPSGSAWQRPAFRAQWRFGALAPTTKLSATFSVAVLSTRPSRDQGAMSPAHSGGPRRRGALRQPGTQRRLTAPPQRTTPPRRSVHAASAGRPAGTTEAARAPRVQPRLLHPNPPSQHADATPTPDAEPRCQTASAPRSPVVRVSGKALRLL